MGEVMPLLNAA